MKHKRENLKDAIIVDIDGTIANINHRRKYVESKPKDWDKFFSLMYKDKPNETVIDIIKKYKRTGEKIILCTGRMSMYEVETDNWLKKMGVHYDELFMRENGDFRADDIVKKEIYQNVIEDYYNVVLVLDDRNRVVKMWRELGLTCFQVAEGDF